MSVRKRTWTNRKGEALSAWVVSYTDQRGKRRQKTYARKKDADAHHARIRIEVQAGLHTPESESMMIAEAGKLWIATAKANKLEQSTVADYDDTLRLHIVPHIGRVKLSQLSAPMVRQFEDRLREAGASAVMVRRVRTRLSMLIADALERGLVCRNVVRELRRGKENKADRRAKGRLKAGVDIPTPAEIRAMLPHAQGRWRALFMVAVFCGLRASELRGLRWQDIDLAKSELHVRQRADRYNKIGRPKSEAGERSVPFPAPVLHALKEWKLACPRSALDLAFPNGRGNVETRNNIVLRALHPIQVKAGITAPVLGKDGLPKTGKDGKPVVKAKYAGLHSLRHFFASWCINRRSDGGLELPGKVVQERLGHSTIGMTMDVYGHLFPRADDSAELEHAASHLFAVPQ